MDQYQSSTDSLAAVAAKAGPSVSVTAATIFGYNVSDAIVWVTLIYTVLMAGHKLYQIYRDVRGRDDKK